MEDVLIVDDAPFVREVLRSILQQAGMNVVGEAKDGVSAVQEALKSRPSVILMDMVMPNKNGIQATEEILAQLPNTRIFACSTLEESVMKDKALSAGCVGYICKPFIKEDIIQAISAGGSNG